MDKTNNKELKRGHKKQTNSLKTLKSNKKNETIDRKDLVQNHLCPVHAASLSLSSYGINHVELEGLVFVGGFLPL